MLMDMLGVLTGFVTVILVLSLVVTAVVQGLQSFLRLRGRALQAALTRMRETIHTDASKASKNRDRSVAAAMRKSAHLNENWLGGEFMSFLFATPVTAVTPDDVLLMFEDGESNPDVRLRIDELFPRMLARAEALFLRNVRLVTILVSLFVAAYFQVSTPALLNRLSEEPELRERLVSEGVALVVEGKSEANATETLKLVGEDALAELAAIVSDESSFPTDRFSEVVKRVEVAMGHGENRVELLNEMRSVLTEKIDGQNDLPPESVVAVLAEYSRLIDSKSQEQMSSAMTGAQAAISRTSRFNDVMGWKGWEFYWENELKPGTKPEDSTFTRTYHGDNIFGVLMTAALLTFGAPFWFERLRDLINLRDALHPSRGGKGDASESNTDETGSGAPNVARRDDDDLDEPIGSSDLGRFADAAPQRITERLLQVGPPLNVKVDDVDVDVEKRTLIADLSPLPGNTLSKDEKDRAEKTVKELLADELKNGQLKVIPIEVEWAPEEAGTTTKPKDKAAGEDE